MAPLLKPARNAAFDAAVALKRLFTSPGAILGVPGDELIENALKAGEFCAKLSTTIPGKCVVEDADTPANYRVAFHPKHVWSVSEPEARLHRDGGEVRQRLPSPGLDRCVVRRVHIVIEREEGFDRSCKAIRCTDGIGIMLEAQGQSQREVALDLPIVFHVAAQVVERGGKFGGLGEGLREVADAPHSSGIKAPEEESS